MRVVVLGQPRDEVLVGVPTGVAHVFVVVKDPVEAVQTVGGQQADRADHVSGGAGGEGAAGEANEDDVVVVDIIGADEVVDGADVAIEAHAEGPAGELVDGVGGADAGEVVDDLVGAIGARPTEAA